MTTAPAKPEPVDCNRCGKTLDTLEELAGAMLWEARSPLMPTPCPPFVTCEGCAIVLFAGFGVEQAKQHMAERGLS